ncbi:MAG: cation transporter [Salinivirgaceae bacterium]|nr:cation transporter [Salinivirgaceae bacterium]
MSHDHSQHNHAPASLKNINRVFYIGIILNSVFTAVEFVFGYLSNSLALISDASHNLSDVASLIISLLGMKLAQKAANYTYTYGYKKASILASLINAVLLLIVVFSIFKEAIERLTAPPEVMGKVIIITAIIGVLINSISALLFFKGQKSDINVKGAFIHLMVDALVSVGVVIAGIIIHYTQWNLIDPILSFVIGGIIVVSTYGLLKESLKLTLDGIPKEIDYHKIETLIAENKHVKNVHHIHIWALSSNINALTAHVCLDNNSYSQQEIMKIKDEIKHQIEHHKIQHITLEIDADVDSCKDVNC